MVFHLSRIRNYWLILCHLSHLVQKSLEAVRVAFPQSAGVVFLAPQLPKSVPEWWIAPEEVDAPHVTSCFHVDMSEWTACVRRMFRANFGLELPSDSCCPSLAAGALPVLTHMKSWCIVHCVQVRRACGVSFYVSMKRWNCTSEMPLTRQVTAPRILWTWLENPSGSYLDSAADTSMGSWCSADLVSSGSDMQHVESSKIFQVGITALIMGDLNSGAAVEEAHLRRLLASGCLDNDTLLYREKPFQGARVARDVHADDLAPLQRQTFQKENVDMGALRAARVSSPLSAIAVHHLLPTCAVDA